MRHYFLLLLVGVALAAGCSPSKKTFSNAADWLPPDFDVKKDILLIDKVSWPARQQRLMEEYMKKNYAYQYEFINANTSLSTKYTDTLKYRFVILNTSGSYTMQSSNFSRPGLTVGMFDFYFYDRMKRKRYPTTNRASSWASMTFKPMVNTILKK